MKKLAILLMALVVAPTAMAWGGFGHQVIVEIAKQNLTKRAAQNIERYMPYDIVEDASWMDAHRHDKEIAYTTHWHGFRYDKNHKYDEAASPKGNAIIALRLAEKTLSNYREQTDSAVLMSLRFVLHFVGDMHCQTHANPGPTARVAVTLRGKKYKNLHTVYDAMPRLLYPYPTTAIAAAQELDNCSKKRIAKITSGSYEDWANEIASKAYIIHEWCPAGMTKLPSDLILWSEEMTKELLRDAGYRTAMLLNRFFDHD